MSLLLALSAPAESVAATQEEAADANEAVVCKYTRVVGSRIPTKVCLTKFEWEERARAQMEAKRSSLNRNSYCANEGPC